MWKKIEDSQMVEGINPGNHITDDPNNPEDFYEVKDIHTGFVVALHANGKTKIKAFLEAELIDKWWVKS